MNKYVPKETKLLIEYFTFAGERYKDLFNCPKTKIKKSKSSLLVHTFKHPNNDFNLALVNTVTKESLKYQKLRAFTFESIASNRCIEIKTNLEEGYSICLTTFVPILNELKEVLLNDIHEGIKLASDLCSELSLETIKSHFSNDISTINNNRLKYEVWVNIHKLRSLYEDDIKNISKNNDYKNQPIALDKLYNDLDSIYNSALVISILINKDTPKNNINCLKDLYNYSFVV